MLTAHVMSLLVAWLQVSVPPSSPVPQPIPQADSGSRVRITVHKPEKHSLVGTLVSADADSLRFTTDTGGVVAVPVASVSRLERSRGRRSNAGRGALTFGLIGGAAGLVLGIAAAADNTGWGIDFGPEAVVGATVLMGATGAGLGALIGAASKGERWEPVTAPGRAANRTSQGRSIARAGVTIGF